VNYLKVSKKTDVKVDLEDNKVTVIRTLVDPVFRKNGAYRIETAADGFSEIRKEEDGYYLNIYIFEDGEFKIIQTNKLTESNVISLIDESERIGYTEE